MTTAPAFAGSIPENYHTLLGPMLFESYAKDIAARVRGLGLAPDVHVLELAAGTGIVTKVLLEVVPARGRLTVTDVSEPMLVLAKSYVPADPRLTLTPADACAVPFADRSFDAIVCQYGVMFFPDKVKAMSEARRVLKPGGAYVFNVWGPLATNPIAEAVHNELGAIYPAKPPAFLNTPFGYSDKAEIERVARAGGFTRVSFNDLTVPCTVPTAEHAARALLQGTPLAADLAERKADVPALVKRVTKVLGDRFGQTPCSAPMHAVVIEAR